MFYCDLIYHHTTGTKSFGTGLLEMSTIGNRKVLLRYFIIFLELKNLVILGMNLHLFLLYWRVRNSAVALKIYPLSWLMYLSSRIYQEVLSPPILCLKRKWGEKGETYYPAFNHYYVNDCGGVFLTPGVMTFFCTVPKCWLFWYRTPETHLMLFQFY